MAKTSQGSSFDKRKALEAVESPRRSCVAARSTAMPGSCLKGYLKAAAGKASPRAAIKAHCLECCGWDRSEVAECVGYACPLWKYRPFQGDKK